MTVKELLKMVRADLKKWSNTRDGKAYRKLYNKNKAKS
jgi:hypothetical protein